MDGLSRVNRATHGGGMMDWVWSAAFAWASQIVLGRVECEIWLDAIIYINELYDLDDELYVG